MIEELGFREYQQIIFTFVGLCGFFFWIKYSLSNVITSHIELKATVKALSKNYEMERLLDTRLEGRIENMETWRSEHIEQHKAVMNTLSEIKEDIHNIELNIAKS